MMFIGVLRVEYSDQRRRGIIQGGVMHISPLNTENNCVMSSLIIAQRVSVVASSFLPPSSNNTDSGMLLSGITLLRERGTIIAR